MPGYGDEDIEAAIMLATVRTSRKARDCATCGGQIRPGEQYRRIFFPPGDHGPATFSVHLSAGDCWSVLAYADSADPGAALQAVLNPEFLPGGGAL
jgi:hypothetical protein